MARASSNTIAPRAAASPTWAWPARSSAASAAICRLARRRRGESHPHLAGGDALMATKKPALGRGLSSLIREAVAPSRDESGGDRLRNVPIEQMQPGKYQPRSHMDQDRLAELAESIKSQGLIQPIIVRPIGPDRYEIIAGERRWRAAQLAALREVPVVVRESDDHAALAMALIENIQREDLNPLEEAVALQRLIDEFQLTHQQAADAVGRSRAAVSNLLRLLELPEEIRVLLEDRKSVV